MVITLIANPLVHPLDSTHIHNFIAFLDTLSVTVMHTDVLATNEAIDIFIHHFPVALLKAQCEAYLAQYPYDCCIQETKSRQKKLLLTDMDSTIIGQECIDELAESLGFKPQVSAITERAMHGELDFETSLTERVALLKGLQETELLQVYQNKITLNPGAKTLIQTMKSRGNHSVLVSGGFTFFTERIAIRLGFDAHRANQLEIQQGVLTGKVIPPILGKEAKLEHLNTYAKKWNLTPTHVIAVGDGANDLAMIEASGLGVAYRAKPAVCLKSDFSVLHSDLTALLYCQGIHKNSFVN